MPTYDYECTTCEHAWELFQSISENPKRKCPSCGKLTAQRLIGAGAAVLFKGSGFYQTDYRSDSYKKGAKEDSKSAESSAKATESKPKSESTPTAKPSAKSD